MDQPLLLLDVEPPSDFHLDSGRVLAINQIIQHLDEIGPTNQHTERLYAISAIGKRWRAVYVKKGKGSKGGQPVRGVAAVNSLKSGDPNCWNPDITSEASWVALQSIATASSQARTIEQFVCGTLRRERQREAHLRDTCMGSTLWHSR